MPQPHYLEHSLVFMGTPDFAVSSLAILLRDGFQVAAVVTAPDKPAGRGMKVTESAVKQFAVSKGLRVLQPEKLKDPEFIKTLKEIHADLFVVVAFRMLPEVVWNMPRMGTINLHGSLLPQYRGAAPINWAVINGEQKTGVTTFLLKHEIDTGNILMQEDFPIGEDETAGDVHDRMKTIGGNLLSKTVEQIFSGGIKEFPQPNVPFKHAPKIFTETCKIDWNKPVAEIHNLIRGLSPYPGAFTSLNDKGCKILKSKKEVETPRHEPGAYDTDKKTYLKFAAIDGYIHVVDLQLEGKKRMPVEEFLKGYRF